MKAFTIILFLALISCSTEDCNVKITTRQIDENGRELGWMIHGGIMDKYIAHETYTLEKVDPYEWDRNLYFTGEEWTHLKQHAMRSTDTCMIKSAYIKWLNKQ